MGGDDGSAGAEQAPDRQQRPAAASTRRSRGDSSQQRREGAAAATAPAKADSKGGFFQLDTADASPAAGIAQCYYSINNVTIYGYRII